MIRQEFLNLHHLIPGTGTQTNTKFTGLAYKSGIWMSVIQMSLVFVCLLFISHLRSKIKLMSNVDWTKLWFQSTQKSDRFKLHLFFVLLSDQASFFVRLPISIIYSFSAGRIRIVNFLLLFFKCRWHYLTFYDWHIHSLQNEVFEVVDGCYMYYTAQPQK